jgi:excisionase family DNA binding protein
MRLLSSDKTPAHAWVDCLQLPLPLAHRDVLRCSLRLARELIRRPLALSDDGSLTVQELARLMETHRATLYRWIQCGALPPPNRRVGNQKGWLLSSLVTWLADHTDSARKLPRELLQKLLEPGPTQSESRTAM